MRRRLTATGQLTSLLAAMVSLGCRLSIQRRLEDESRQEPSVHRHPEQHRNQGRKDEIAELVAKGDEFVRQRRKRSRSRVDRRLLQPVEAHAPDLERENGV